MLPSLPALGVDSVEVGVAEPRVGVDGFGVIESAVALVFAGQGVRLLRRCRFRRIWDAQGGSADGTVFLPSPFASALAPGPTTLDSGAWRDVAADMWATTT
jgi:hypothetical protein